MQKFLIRDSLFQHPHPEYRVQPKLVEWDVIALRAAQKDEETETLLGHLRLH